MIQGVTGCKDCPLYNWTGREYGCYCEHPNRQGKEDFDNENRLSDEIEDDDNGDPITPDWCPLKKESITIEMEKI